MWVKALNLLRPQPLNPPSYMLNPKRLTLTARNSSWDDVPAGSLGTFALREVRMQCLSGCLMSQIE